MRARWHFTSPQFIREYFRHNHIIIISRCFAGDSLYCERSPKVRSMHLVYRNAAKPTEEASTSWSASTSSSGHPKSIVFVRKSGVVAWKKWCLSGFNLPVQLLPLLKYFILLQCCLLREKHLCRTCSRSSEYNKRPLLARDEKQKLAWVCRCMRHIQNQNEGN